MRFWLSGPRILGIRPGVLFRPDELFQKSPFQRQTQGGFIYVIRSDNGFLKIGVSSDPNARLAQLRTGSAVPLKIAYAGALRCDGYAIEAAAHETLSRYRLEGEWFNCPTDMAVAAIGAAAHRLGEPIASVDPAQVGDVVRAVALSNQAGPTKPKSWFRLWLAAVLVLWAIIFYFLNQFISARSP